MTRFQRFHFHQPRKTEQIEEHDDRFRAKNSGNSTKRSKPKLLSVLFLSFLCFCFVSVHHHLFNTSVFSILDSSLEETVYREAYNIKTTAFSSISKVSTDTNQSVVSNTSPNLKGSGGFAGSDVIHCDRTCYRSDICFMKGDIRTHSPSSSIFLYTSNEEDEDVSHEKMKPYTRKWEKSVMNTIQEINLIKKKPQKPNAQDHKCDVNHSVPAVVFSAGGYTGNVYHEFNDGILPLFITSQRFKKQVVFVVLEYHQWWKMKYEEILSELSDHPVIDFGKDRRTHCFSEAIVGLRIHNELTIDSSLMQENTSVTEFRNFLYQAYKPESERDRTRKPNLVFLFRRGSRAITNENTLVKLARKIGFRVSVLRPISTTQMVKIYRMLNSANVMVGVHGAALTHFLFMKPTGVFIQIIPIGTDWPAETYYGEPAKRFGLKYIGYKIKPKESSLYNEYHKDHPVLANPASITAKGWNFTKKIYLENQRVRIDSKRFQKTLLDAYAYLIRNSRKKIKNP